jgi:DNA-3-methyladenine glycosylase II
MNTPALHHPLAPLAAAALCERDGIWQRITEKVGPCQLPAPRLQPPFEALIRAIAHQQLHARAAEAILNRFLAYFGGPYPAPAAILAADDAPLRAAGLSASKLAAIRDLCRRAEAGEIPDLAQAQTMDSESLITALTRVRGIGRWSVEMLLIFGLGRPDVLPVDDFGVREGWRKAMGLPAQPRPRALGELGAAWAPWRSFAAWYLWQANNHDWTPP